MWWCGGLVRRCRVVTLPSGGLRCVWGPCTGGIHAWRDPCMGNARRNGTRGVAREGLRPNRYVRTDERSVVDTCMHTLDARTGCMHWMHACTGCMHALDASTCMHWMHACTGCKHLNDALDARTCMHALDARTGCTHWMHALEVIARGGRSPNRRGRVDLWVRRKGRSGCPKRVIFARGLSVQLS